MPEGHGSAGYGKDRVLSVDSAGVKGPCPLLRRDENHILIEKANPVGHHRINPGKQDYHGKQRRKKPLLIPVQISDSFHVFTSPFSLSYHPPIGDAT